MSKSSGNNSRIETLRIPAYLPQQPFPLFIKFYSVANPVKMHRHEFMELVIVSEGMGIHFTDTEEYAIEAGDVFAITGDTAHGYKDVKDLQVVNLLFDPKWFFSLTSLARESLGFHALFSLEPRFRKVYHCQNKLHLTKKELHKLLELVYILIEELAAKKTLHELIVQTVFLHFVGLLSRFYDQREILPSDSLLKVGQCLSLIEKNYDKPIRLASLANTIHVSPRSLLRIFKNILGTSPIDYLIRLRIEKARELLYDSGLSITQIAYLVGFNDSNYFARQFKKITGITPRSISSKIPLYK
jgi:AraC-like DNA-binding protein